MATRKSVTVLFLALCCIGSSAYGGETGGKQDCPVIGGIIGALIGALAGPGEAVAGGLVGTFAGHVITKFSGMGRFTKLWGSAHARAKRARGAPL